MLGIAVLRHHFSRLIPFFVLVLLVYKGVAYSDPLTAISEPATTSNNLVMQTSSELSPGTNVVASLPPLAATQIITGDLYMPYVGKSVAQTGLETFLPELPEGHQPESGYPFVTSSQVQLDDSRTRVTYFVTNNITRSIDSFSLEFNASAELGSVESAGVSATPPVLFDTAQSDNAQLMQCRFSLKAGQVLAPAQRAELSCTYRRNDSTIATHSDQISPRPSPADRNYDQIHDLLSTQIASLQPTNLITVIVLLAQPATQSDLDLFTSFDGAILEDLELIDGFAGVLPAGQVAVYRAAAGTNVHMIQPDLPALLEVDTATANTRARNVWTGNLLGSNVVTETQYALTGDPKTAIAIVDSGIDVSHPALGPYRNFLPADWAIPARVAANKMVGWMDFDPVASTQPLDGNGHGSNVAGIAAGIGAGVAGGVDLRGVAHTAKLVGARVSFSFGTTLLVRALTWVRNNSGRYHVIVVNTSFGSAAVDPALIVAAERLVQSGVIVVKSAGNAYDNARPDGIPIAAHGVAPKVLTVGAVNDADQVSFFSSNGGDPRIFAVRKPDVVAPGGTVTISLPYNFNAQMNGPDTNGPEEFIDTNRDGVHQPGDRCLDLNGNRHWDLHLDLFLDTSLDFIYQAGEPVLDNNGVPGFQPGGDICLDSHLPGGGALTGELYFDRNNDSIHNGRGGATPAVANDYSTQAGTSQAAPVVSGEVALIIDAITDYDLQDSDNDGNMNDDHWDGIDDENDDIIDEDPGEWVYRETFARLVKSIVLMTTYEVAGGELVPRQWLYFDENRDGWGSRRADEIIFDANSDYIFNAGDTLVLRGRNGVTDTINGHNFTPGDADQLRDPIYINAAASNAPGDDGSGGGIAGDGITDALDRGGKDRKEGYGRVAIDAAIEAVTKEFCAVESDTFGNGLTDKKVWARHLHLYADKEYKAILDVPAGADYDLYLYQGIPSADGEPVIAKRPDNTDIRSTTAATADNANDESITFEVQATGLYFLIVRRVSGAGQFTVRLITPEEWTVMVYLPAELEGAANLDDLAFQAINDLEQSGSGEESMQAFQVLALVDYDQHAWDGKDGTGGQPDHRGDAVLYCVRKDHKNDEHHYSIAKQPAEVLTLANRGLVTQTAEINMGDPDSVRRFVAWAVDYFPAQKYALILWGDGRGYGWKVNPAKALGPGNDAKATPGQAAPVAHDALEMAELRAAMAAAKTEIISGSQFLAGTGVNKNLDLLGLDMGHMALIEVGRQVQESVEVMVASEERIANDGWPYKELLTQLFCVRRLDASWDCADPKATDAEALGKHAVAVYHSYYEAGATADAKHTLSAVRLNPQPDGNELAAAQDECGSFDKLVICVNSFAQELAAGVDDYLDQDDPTDNVQVKIEHEGRQASEEMEDHNYIDLRHFAQNIQASSVPEKYKSQANPIFIALANAGPIVLASEHGSAHPNAHGLTIYFPYDQLLPEDANCKDAPDNSDRTCGFDNPLPAKHMYAKDGSILVSALRMPLNSPTHPRPQINGLRFPVDTMWDEFLHRYYKPVADACIRVAGGCVEEAIVQVGESVTLSGNGSSDSDGPAKDDLPQAYYWDLDGTVDSAGAVPAYPVPPAAPVDDPCTEDCDRNAADGKDDDPNATGVTLDFTCRAAREYLFNLMVHDEHNDHAQVHDEESHYVHWKLDTESVTLKCEPPMTPRKVPDRSVTTPGGKLAYTIYVPANPDAATTTFAEVQDQLPPILQFEEFTTCTFANCMHNPIGNQIFAAGPISPGQLHIMTYSVTVAIPDSGTCPPMVENEAFVFDGVASHQAGSQTTIDCSEARPGQPGTPGLITVPITP